MSGERRLRACVAAWPDAETGAYNPACCRFPKSCSATVYPDNVDQEHLEPVTAASGADQPTLRDQLAAWLCNEDERAPAWEFCEDDDRDYWRRKADRLLPLIEADRERAKAEGGAEALEKAAKIALPASGVRGLLLDRAVALRGSTGGAG